MDNYNKIFLGFISFTLLQFLVYESCSALAKGSQSIECIKAHGTWVPETKTIEGYCTK